MTFSTLFDHNLFQQGHFNIANFLTDSGTRSQATQVSDFVNLFRGAGRGTYDVTQVSDDLNVASIGEHAPSIDDLLSDYDYPTNPTYPNHTESIIGEGVFVSRGKAATANLKWYFDNSKIAANNSTKAFSSGMARERREAADILSGVNKNIKITGGRGHLNIITETGEKIALTPETLAEKGTLVLADGTRLPATYENINSHTKLVKNKKGSSLTKDRDMRVTLHAFMVQNPGAYVLFKVGEESTASDSYSGSYGSVIDKLIKVTASLFSWTPLTIDMNGDGLQLTKDATANRNGEATSWVQAGGDDVFVVIDRGTDGVEMLGENTTGDVNDNGFTQLAEFDSNGDGKFDAADKAYKSGEVKIWHDHNSDGQVDEGELSKMADKGIASIDLAFDVVDKAVNFNEVPYAGKVTLANGQERDIFDVMFNKSEAPADGADEPFVTL